VKVTIEITDNGLRALTQAYFQFPDQFTGTNHREIEELLLLLSSGHNMHIDGTGEGEMCTVVVSNMGISTDEKEEDDDGETE